MKGWAVNRLQRPFSGVGESVGSGVDEGAGEPGAGVGECCFRAAGSGLGDAVGSGVAAEDGAAVVVGEDVAADVGIGEGEAAGDANGPAAGVDSAGGVGDCKGADGVAAGEACARGAKISVGVLGATGLRRLSLTSLP